MQQKAVEPFCIDLNGPVECIELSSGIETEGEEAGSKYTEMLLTVEGRKFPVRVYAPRDYSPLMRAFTVEVSHAAVRPEQKIPPESMRKAVHTVFLVGR